jgi:hypothetical protein
MGHPQAPLRIEGRPPADGSLKAHKVWLNYTRKTNNLSVRLCAVWVLEGKRGLLLSTRLQKLERLAKGSPTITNQVSIGNPPLLRIMPRILRSFNTEEDLARGQSSW